MDSCSPAGVPISESAMRQMPPRAPPEPSTLRSGRGLHPSRWLLARRDASRDGSALTFGIRLVVTVVLTFALIGSTSYVLLERSLAHQEISNYAEGQRADAKAFEREGTRATSTADEIGDIERLLEGVEQRPGTLAVLLIDKQHVVRAAGNGAQVGTAEADARIEAALEHGSSYAGREGGRGKDSSDFEFIVPVNLPSGRYAYEVTYDHRTYDAQLSELRTILALIALITLIGGGAVFRPWMELHIHRWVYFERAHGPQCPSVVKRVLPHSALTKVFWRCDTARKSYGAAAVPRGPRPAVSDRLPGA